MIRQPAFRSFEAQADTIIPGAGNPQAWDRYAYAYNNPVKYNDPSGHAVQEDYGPTCTGKSGKKCATLDELSILWNAGLNKNKTDYREAAVETMPGIGQGNNCTTLDCVMPPPILDPSLEDVPTAFQFEALDAYNVYNALTTYPQPVHEKTYIHLKEVFLGENPQSVSASRFLIPVESNTGIVFVSKRTVSLGDNMIHSVVWEEENFGYFAKARSLLPDNWAIALDSIRALIVEPYYPANP